MNSKPCAICSKMMECAGKDWSSYQPHGGGEIDLIFSYGSKKFDKHMWSTSFVGLICDDCAEKIIKNGHMDTMGDPEE